MVREKRIIEDFSGDNANASINFIPKMHINTLLNGYKHTMRELYSSRKYYERLKTFLKLYHHTAPSEIHIKFIDMVALFISFLYVGVFSRMRYDFWILLYWTIFRKPWLLKLVIHHSIYGCHFQKVMNKYMK
jgi:hypothetical protein